MTKAERIEQSKTVRLTFNVRKQDKPRGSPSFVVTLGKLEPLKLA